MIKRRSTFFKGIATTALLLGLCSGATAWADDLAGLQVKPAVQLEKTTELAPGVKYRKYTGKTAQQGQLLVNVIEADITRKDVEVRPLIAADGITGRETLSSMAQRTNAVAAINGSFFSTSSPYLPVGNVVIDGQCLAVSDMLRTSMGWFKDGTVKFGYFKPGLAVTLQGAGQAVDISKVNRNASGQEVVLYTPHWGNTAGNGQNDNLVSLVPGSNGTYLVAEQAVGKINIPSNGLVLRLPADLAGAFWTGSEVKVSQASDLYWEGVRHLLTSGPLLVESGEPVFQAIQEGFTGTVLQANPRTAVGVTKSGQMLLVAIDGRSQESAGLTLEELSYLMADLGAYNAMALDGGGSTAMWVQGAIVNKPSDGKERALNNGLIVVAGIPVYLNGERLYFDVPPQLIKGRTLVPFRKIFERMGAQVNYDSSAKMITAVKGEQIIQFKAGAKEALVNGQQQILDVPAQEVNGRTLVPLRFAGVALGAQVTWTQEQTVLINTPQAAY